MYILILICVIIISIKGYVLNNELQFVKVENKYLGKTIPLRYNSNRNNIKNYIDNNSKINTYNKEIKFKLPNTLLIKNKYKNNPVLSIDLGSKNVGISFNYLNEFYLYKNIQFTNYDNLVSSILTIIKELYNKYQFNINIGEEYDEYNRFLVLIGLPYHNKDNLGNYFRDMGFNSDNDKVNNNLKLLYQILYTLDFSSYLSFHLYKFINSYIKNSVFNTPIINNERDEEYLHTQCLYCSIVNNTTTTGSNTTSSNNRDRDVSDDDDEKKNRDTSSNKDVDKGDRDSAKDVVCKLKPGVSCLNTTKVSNLTMGMLLGINENFSTFQTESLVDPMSFDHSNSRSDKLKTKINMGISLDSRNQVHKNRNSLSSLNIYYNLINNKYDNFLILPNNNPIFNNTKSHNILLYKYIKNFVISNNYN